jgi:hypothetical protein
MQLRFSLMTALALGFCVQAEAGIIDTTVNADDFFADGAISLTGPLPDSGNVGTSVTLGDATLSAGNSIFVGSGWSSLMPGGNAIAISGPENLDISIDTGLATAFGFYFHEPSANHGLAPDSCNAACVDSTFNISFWLGGVLLDSILYSPSNDSLRFGGIYLDEVFDEVRFVETGGIDNEFFGEMYAVRVSEPATLWLLGASLIGIGLMRRRIAGPRGENQSVAGTTW